MEISEIEDYLTDFEKSMGIEENFLKYPIDMLVEFNEDNIKEKIKENVKQIFKFKKLYYIAESKYIELLSLQQDIIGQQYDWYKFEFDRSLSMNEVKEFYITKDPKVKQVKRMLIKQQIQKNFFKLCIDSFIIQGERMHDFIKI